MVERWRLSCKPIRTGRRDPMSSFASLCPMEQPAYIIYYNKFPDSVPFELCLEALTASERPANMW